MSTVWCKNSKNITKQIWIYVFCAGIVVLWMSDYNSIEHKLKNSELLPLIVTQSCEQFTHLDHQTGGCCLIEMVGILGTFSDMFGL